MPSPAVNSAAPLASFQDFAQRLQSGDNDAYGELMTRYASRLRAMALGSIGPQLRSKYDAEDVLQSVLRDFVTSIQDGCLDFESSRAMRGLLGLMIKRKCAHYAGNFASAKRDLRREHQDAIDVTFPELPSRDPAPEAALIAGDELAHRLRSLDDMDRQIVVAVLQGESSRSIAERLKTSQRTIQRTVKRACLRLGGGDPR
jgi:RNA polymerase sigma factor (sigma-70 family)